MTTHRFTGKEFWVATDGSDNNAGSVEAPFQTISAAAQVAQPGDVITVRAGVYRERINPPRGGTSDECRITYQAAPGEKVEIKGSELVRNWAHVQGDVWKTVVPNSLFGAFNPYRELIGGDWFRPHGRRHHRGAVYLNGEWIYEACALDDVLDPASDQPFWFAEVDDENTTIWCRFKGVNPNEQLVEINVRPVVFYPAAPGINYITVRGFVLAQAATQWAPPTSEQIAIVGTHWSKGWIIENNTITHSACAGVSLGKYGDDRDNTSASLAVGYVETILRAQRNGWDKEIIGHHIVRNNTISHCEQAGILGSLGAIFCRISGNHIHSIYNNRRFSGYEIAGIKFHAPIDTVIERNVIHHVFRGMWMDWMTQGTRISGNICYDNDVEDLYMEVNHGPFVVDNNLFLSRHSILVQSQGGAYLHNLIRGELKMEPQSRVTPYHFAHSTELAGLDSIKGGDDRFYNNIFIGYDSGLVLYDRRDTPVHAGGNLYYDGASPYGREQSPFLAHGIEVRLEERDGHGYLHLALKRDPAKVSTHLITTKDLGETVKSRLPFENPDGSMLRIDTDYLGNKRGAHPTPGPFEGVGAAPQVIQVW